MKLRILSLLLAVLMLASACAFTACSDPVEPDGQKEGQDTELHGGTPFGCFLHYRVL